MNNSKSLSNVDKGVPSIHVCLLSAQLLPNLIPILMDEAVQNVVLFAGDSSMNLEGNTFVHVLKTHGIKVSKIHVANSSFDFDKLKESAAQLYSWLNAEYPQYKYVVNTTCGTKIMSLAVTQELINKTNVEVIYCNSQDNEIINLTDTKNNVAIKSVLDINTLLKANYFNVTSNDADDPEHGEQIERRAHIATQMALFAATHADKNPYLLSALINAPASEARSTYLKQSSGDNQSKLECPLTIKAKKSVLRGKIVSQIADLVTIEQEDASLTYTNFDAACFLSGGWLEEYVYNCALAAGANHVGLSVEGTWNRTGKKYDDNALNEIDVAIAHLNKMIVIECKSGLIEQNAQNISNKLSILSQSLGGHYGEGILVMAQKPSEHILARCAQYKIEVIEPKHLLNLTNMLKQRLETLAAS